MNDRRVVVLVPSPRDLSDPDARTRYWPNFVFRVKAALHDLGLEADVHVAGAVVADTITCPTCSRVSTNPGDILNHYCGHCHRFHATAGVR